MLLLRYLHAREAGWLLGMGKTADVIDAVVVMIALRQKAMILTGDPYGIKRLALPGTAPNAANLPSSRGVRAAFLHKGTAAKPGAKHCGGATLCP